MNQIQKLCCIVTVIFLCFAFNFIEELVGCLRILCLLGWRKCICIGLKVEIFILIRAPTVKEIQRKGIFFSRAGKSHGISFLVREF